MNSYGDYFEIRRASFLLLLWTVMCHSTQLTLDLDRPGRDFEQSYGDTKISLGNF